MADDQPKRFLANAYAVKSAAETRALYDRWAEVYDEELTENDYRQPARCAEALSAMLAPGPDTTVIDIGCGSGLSGIALADAGFTTIDGCDLSPGMLAKADELGLYRRLFEADLNQPPLDAPDAAYDAATCVGVFSYGHVGADALDDIVRVVKPGGCLVVGLNDHFYRQGALMAKLDAMESDELLADRTDTHGEHIIGTGLTGWVIKARKTLG